MYCDKEGCNGPVKPDLIFIGEERDYTEEFEHAFHDLEENCDLLIVIGSRLDVSPFN